MGNPEQTTHLDAENKKTCSKCGENKPLTDFYSHKGYVLGVTSVCRLCRREYGKAYEMANREKINKRKKEYYKANREKRNEYSRDHARKRYWEDPSRRDHLCEVQRKNRAKDPERFRGYELKKRFKMSLEEFERRLLEQGNCCAICRDKEPGGRYGIWHVDHDRSHCSGRKSCGLCVRALLCHYCNMTLGNAKDSPDRLRKAAEYLEKHSRKS